MKLTHYTLSNPATGFPFVLRMRDGRPVVERAVSLAIEFVRDVRDAARLTAAVSGCASLVSAAECLYREHGCDDIEAEHDGRPCTLRNTTVSPGALPLPSDTEQREIECVTCSQVIATCEAITTPFHCNACLGKED